MTRVGVFGGTFDPVHHGHLIAAEEARSALGLERVVFVPARQPPHKPAAPITPALHRLAMLALAIAPEPAFATSRADLDAAGPSYTADLLVRLGAEFGPDVALVFVMGADSLVDLPTWHEPERIVRLATLAVLARPGYAPDLAALERQVPGVTAATRLVDMPRIEISATDLRRRVAAGRPIRFQVPEAVERYVHAAGLYRVADQEPAATSGEPRRGG